MIKITAASNRQINRSDAISLVDAAGCTNCCTSNQMYLLLVTATFFNDAVPKDFFNLPEYVGNDEQGQNNGTKLDAFFERLVLIAFGKGELDFLAAVIPVLVLIDDCFKAAVRGNSRHYHAQLVIGRFLQSGEALTSYAVSLLHGSAS